MELVEISVQPFVYGIVGRGNGQGDYAAEKNILPLDMQGVITQDIGQTYPGYDENMLGEMIKTANRQIIFKGRFVNAHTVNSNYLYADGMNHLRVF